jgi:hypothetical protein
MPKAASFESFEKELNRLVGIFERGLAEFRSSGYVEAQLRDDFLSPFFRALGWDLENSAGLIQTKREAEIESRTEIGGRQKRADYLFRTDGHNRFVCEAKKPAEMLHAGCAFQAKRYAWNKDLPLSILSNFEEFKIYIVGGKPHTDEPLAGLWKSWHFRQLPIIAQEIWNLLARDRVAAGSIDQLLETLPKTPTGKGKARQQWLIKPDRSRSLDVDFLNFLDEARRDLASDLIRHNDRADLLEGSKLNEAVQHILDRILFLRICEDRDIDTGTRLDSIRQTWRRNFEKEEGGRAHQKPLELHDAPLADYGYSGIRAPKDSLWRGIVRHFRALDRRPPSHVPFFNGNLFKPHFSEELIVGDDWLAGFVADLSDDESPYLFNYIPVEILGTIYERFLGKIVRPQGRGVTIEEKPEVRKAGGVYYTPRYIVEYIVAQTVEKLLRDDKPEATLKLHFLDPACGSGSFLLRVFEVVCEHWEQWFMSKPGNRKGKWCWVDEKTGAVHLTMSLKRQILTSNVFGVDLDPGAVEVTQLSLYLKMLENENRNTLQRQRELLPENDDPLLPPLENNVKCGNSLIASDFSMMPEDLVRVRAFDWPVQFAPIMKAGGFDAVVGNPPYGATLSESDIDYFRNNYALQQYQLDTYIAFLERSIGLAILGGVVGMIIPNTWLLNVQMPKIREHLVSKTTIEEIVHFAEPVFNQATVDTDILVLRVESPSDSHRATISFVNRDGVWEKFKTPQSRWRKLAGGVMNILERPGMADLADRLRAFPRLADFYKVTQGAKPFQVGKGKPRQTRAIVDAKPFVSDKKLDRTFKPLLRGSLIHRYIIEWNNNSWISFGDWLAEPRYSASYGAPEKIVIRQTGDSLTATLDTRQFIVRDNLYTIIPLKAGFNLHVLLGFLNSKLLGWFYQNVINPEVGEALAQVKRTHLDALPIRAFDLQNTTDKARHDRLVGLVDKLLGLMPKLRQARSEPERQTLQNAVTAADQQVDALVYELYGLTKTEIKLVEGNA